MRASPLLAVLISAAVAGCATLGIGRPSDEDARLAAGLRAIEEGDYRAAHEHLEWTARTHPDEKEGQQALLALAAMELDPRNPGRRLWATADLADRYLGLPETAPWTRPLAESLFLVATELGAAEERTEAAEEENRRLRYEGSTVPQRMRALTEARDAAAGERDQLRTRLANAERSLAVRNDSIAALNREIERIRKLIKP